MGQGRSATLKLYAELARWWPLVSAPEEYAEEAEVFRKALLGTARRPLRDVLELGAGGGNNASHLKQHFSLTLVDLSEDMVEVSRALNPECEHVVGDMRDVRLGRRFDAVFVHDAIDYMTTEADLVALFRTAAIHLHPGGAALFVPDHVEETFEVSTSHGGHDGVGRALRYLEWTRRPSPDKPWYVVDYVFVLRTGDDVDVEHDRHVCGVFPRALWLRLLEEEGFEAHAVTYRLTDWPSGTMFAALKL
jgi:SAM-dependent methyltransferase